MGWPTPSASYGASSVSTAISAISSDLAWGSVDKASVVLDKGEMSFGIFKHSSELDWVVLEGQQSVETLKKLRKEIGNNALPAFLIEYIEAVSQGGAGLLAIHTASSIEGYGSKANQKTISRAKGFMGKSQLETKRFPDAVHHVKIFRNKQGRARLFYKFAGSLQFVQNPKDMPDD